MLTLAFYYFSFAVVWLAVAGLKRILASPFGTVLQAIRENGDRACACGYDVTRIKHLSFVFSAFFAGLAGALDALRLAVFTERWPLVIGLIFMAFVLFLPKGIWGTLVDKLPGGRTAGAKL
jgi:branched-chain amino acid transport system permease protein